MENLVRYAIFGTCPKCGGYLVNGLNDFTAQYALPVVVCQRCGHVASEEMAEFDKRLNRVEVR